MTTITNPLGLPQIATLTSGQRIRITRADTSAYVFDKLGAEPAEGQPEIVIAGACGVPGGEFADLAAVIAAIENPPERVKTTEQIWEEKLAGVIVVEGPVGPLSLKASISACNRFAAMEGLLKSALEHGRKLPDDMTKIYDASGGERFMTIAECRVVLLSYGALWYAMFEEFAP